jgi:hypothetical protein
MKDYVCTWCKQEVNEKDFDSHSGNHYRQQAELMRTTPSMTATSIGSVSYVKEQP